MAKQTKAQRQKARMLKAARSWIRLQFSLKADDVINDVLPDLERKIDAAQSSGAPFEIDFDNLVGIS